MRLIDADNIYGAEDFIKLDKDFNAYLSLNDLCKIIDIQPTAYDVDAVVEQLKTDSSVRLYGSGNSNNYLIHLEKAIEIVKAGVKYED